MVMTIVGDAMKTLKKVLCGILLGVQISTPVMMRADVASVASAFIKPIRTVFWDYSVKPFAWKPLKFAWDHTPDEYKAGAAGVLVTYHLMCFVKRYLWNITNIDWDLRPDAQKNYLCNLGINVKEFSAPATLYNLLYTPRTNGGLHQEALHPNVTLTWDNLKDKVGILSKDDQYHLFVRELRKYRNIRGVIQSERAMLERYKEELRYYTQLFSATRYVPQRVQDMLPVLKILDEDLKGEGTFKEHLAQTYTDKHIQAVKNKIDARSRWYKVLCPSYTDAAKTYLEVLIRLKRLEVMEEFLKNNLHIMVQQ